MTASTLTETLVFELITPTTDPRPIFISGAFCKWLPDVEDFRMTETSPGHYTLRFPESTPLTFPLEYKYTRGGWDQVELDRYGQEHPNRVVYSETDLVQDKITRWRRNMKVIEDRSPIIEVLSEEFYIPQLDKNRRIHVLLPYNYYEQPDRHYPVLYMTDAQNLFGDGSPYENWRIDQELTKLAAEDKSNVIIVAVDHADEEDRFQEISPYDTPKMGKGQGALYLKFITDTLKPQIDRQYRTLSDRLHTGMGGSSVGGLLTIYAALMYPHVFGRLMIFSPSLWISRRIYFDAIHFFEPFEMKIYLYGGGKEGQVSDHGNMIPNIEKLKQTLINQGFGYSRVEIKTEIDPLGKHAQGRWGQEFPKALDWLYNG
ncbi:putative alpha/beta superfamily hydrolase [Dyadobacter jejuensis]|uniref:Putative alpha/beta superfamily hydrolase n=1 Tax=Dyadobacter jejuensis TaxID=1082580 RepID=A0A316AB94_9BACT|nr:alpha/beta hydrolase-fold protein [Dyadobacter jejuensis]PWJ54290.1 putative alpha/beta superfamily hydrolase [Dyadobacter jejuensis]